MAESIKFDDEIYLDGSALKDTGKYAIISQRMVVRKVGKTVQLDYWDDDKRDGLLATLPEEYRPSATGTYIGSVVARDQYGFSDAFITINPDGIVSASRWSDAQWHAFHVTYFTD